MSDGVSCSSASMSPLGRTSSRQSTANAPHQPLGQDRLDRGGDQKRRYAHVAQAGDRAGRVVRVQRAEHHMTGQRRLYRDLGRFDVANLAHQDPVRILPQDGPQALGERVADRGVDRHLHDAVDVVLDRVFGRDQLVLDVIQFATAPSRAWWSCPSPWARSPGRCRWACAMTLRNCRISVGIHADACSGRA